MGWIHGMLRDGTVAVAATPCCTARGSNAACGKGTLQRIASQIGDLLKFVLVLIMIGSWSRRVFARSCSSPAAYCTRLFSAKPLFEASKIRNVAIIVGYCLRCRQQWNVRGPLVVLFDTKHDHNRQQFIVIVILDKCDNRCRVLLLIVCNF